MAIRIAPRFNGPPGSAHGGYTCGLVAGLLGASPARASLRSPPPLGRDLDLIRGEGRVEVRDGDMLVAEGATAQLALDATEPVHTDRAAEASAAVADRWKADHPLPGCFGCGPARRPGDGLRLVSGPLGDGRYAATWTPAATLAAGERTVRREFVWAALDCPTIAPLAELTGNAMAVLAQLHARIDGTVLVDVPYAVISWPLSVDGRKWRAGCAIFNARGGLVALGEALWIELRGFS